MQCGLFFPMIAFLVFQMPTAQSKAPAAGRWQGTVQIADREFQVTLDLAQNEKGEWIGDLDMPYFRLVDAPLSSIVVDGKSISYRLADAPDGPTFQGLLSDDGKEVKGQFSASSGQLPTNMKWISEPNVRLPAKSTPIGMEFEGDWEGTLAAPDGRQMRLRVTLMNGPESATGALLSLDHREWPEVPLRGIVQKGSQISFELNPAGGRYIGQLKEGSLVGELALDGQALPLTLNRPAAEK
jgi:hypothetical protein